MPFQRAHYPANWADLAAQAKDAAGWACAGCGVRHGALAVSRRNRLYRVIVSACHLDHDPDNPTPRLAVYCQACHLRYDAFQRWRSRRAHEREQVVEAGQLAWMPEDPAAAAAQGLS
jgi:hypothetical protein